MNIIAQAAVTAAVLLTNQNILTSPQPVPLTFTVTDSREVFGTTTDGRAFSQTNVAGTHVRLQQFSIDHAWWYISDRGAIGVGQGISPLRALSIYLTL